MKTKLQPSDVLKYSIPTVFRRAVPAAPANFDKILRGELRGAELARVNQQAAEDYNTSALETCSHCGRSANICTL